MVRSVAKVLRMRQPPDTATGDEICTYSVADSLMLCTAQSSTVTLPGRRMVRQTPHKVDLPGPVPSGAAKSRVGGVKRGPSGRAWSPGGSPATAPLPLPIQPRRRRMDLVNCCCSSQSHHQLPNRGQYCMHDIAPACPFLTAEHEMVGLHAIFTGAVRHVRVNVLG
ncbi:hypothetical protein GE21DRAFT_1276320 [Neurospora crassa]|nr:hypothetical protein GE21DRAFT_1276320 [Neurospora crassa]